MIFDVDVSKLNLDINKGEVVIERKHEQKASLSFDDKFKSYITINEEDGVIKVRVSDKLSSFKTVRFHLNLAEAPKCLVHIQTGTIEANALCNKSKYIVDTGSMHVNMHLSSIGTANMHVSVGSLIVNGSNKHTVNGISNHYQGGLSGQSSDFIVDTGTLECNFN